MSLVYFKYCGLTSRIRSTNWPRNYINIFLSFRIYACRNAPDTSKVTASIPSGVLTTRISNNASSDTVGDDTVSPSFRYLLCLPKSSHVLPLMLPYLLYLIKLTASRVLVLFSYFLITLYQSVELLVSLAYQMFSID